MKLYAYRVGPQSRKMVIASTRPRELKSGRWGHSPLEPRRGERVSQMSERSFQTIFNVKVPPYGEFVSFNVEKL